MAQVTDVIDVTENDLEPKITNMVSTPEGYKQINFDYDGLQFEIDQNTDESAILFVKHGNTYYNVQVPEFSIANIFETDQPKNAIHNLMQVLYATCLPDIEKASRGISDIPDFSEEANAGHA